MFKSDRKFIIVCLGISALLLLGTMWVWRQGLMHGPEVDLEVRAIPIIESDNLNESDRDNRTPVINTGDNEAEEKRDEEEKAIVKEFLPSKFNLKVPFTSQAPEKNWEQPWQDACEEAAVLMLDGYYKDYGLSPLFAKDEILKMVEWEKKEGLSSSMKIEEVKKLAEYYIAGGREAQIIESPTVEQIKKFVANGQPVLVVAYGKDLPNPHFRNDGPVYHALIIRGYTEEKFITNDPGTQWGENFSYFYDDLMNAIHDWNGGDVENGRKVVLAVDF